MEHVTRYDVEEQVKILDLAEEHGIQVEPAYSGNFDYKCKCPSEDHKGGAERTPSLHINSEDNNYYCFGCQSYGGSINFYMIASGEDYATAFENLKESVKNPSGKKRRKKNDNIYFLMEISKLFRETMLENPKDLKWMNNLMKKTDSHLESIKPTEVKKTKALLDKLNKVIKERYESSDCW